MIMELKDVVNKKMIAEFMGRPYKFPRIKFATGDAYEEIILPDYSSDWNELMPVVEKIQSIDITPAPDYKGYRIEIVVQGYVKIEGFPMPTIFTNVSKCGSLMKAVYKAVVQFIIWFNSTTLNPLKK